MNKSDQSNKIFANLSIGLLVVGLLVPLIIAIFSTELAMGFGIIAIIIALIFGILGWRYRSGKASVIIIGILIIWSGVVMLRLIHAEKDAIQRQTATKQHIDNQ